MKPLVENDFEALARFALEGAWTGPWMDSVRVSQARLVRPFVHPLNEQPCELVCRWRGQTPWTFFVEPVHSESLRAPYESTFRRMLGNTPLSTPLSAEVHAHAESLLVHHLAGLMAYAQT